MNNFETQNMIESLEKIFAKHDETVLRRNIVWAFEAIAEYHKTNNLHVLPKWLLDYRFRNTASLVSAVTANHEAKITARNEKLVHKMQKEGINFIWQPRRNEIPVHYSDGWNCEITAKTDQGDKTVSLNTTWAGGYNIQCLHTRTTVRIK